ncbi:MAG: cell division protein FtsH, partial [Verrucomicrobia bacterium]|nr:cell division protein FtsH [Verrucomicrobiota bacterium]
MSGDNNSKPEKKGFPGGFLILMLGVFFLILIVQGVNSEKGAKISFSHQVEHLVNLDLIQPQDSKKIALNDNLVTFSGKFKDNLSDEGKARYRYLELLNSNHELQAKLSGIGQELNTYSQNVQDAADWFLHISGLKIPQGGYRVVGTAFDTEQRQNAIVITKLSDRNVTSLVDLQQQLAKLPENPSEEQLSFFNDELLTLVRGFRSPTLGIGTEEIKQKLQVLQKDLTSTPKSKALFQKTLTSLQAIVLELNKEDEGVRLLQLRSVRNYSTALKQYNADYEAFDKNNAELDKARQSVSQVIWFFDGKEISSRALEK